LIIAPGAGNVIWRPKPRQPEDQQREKVLVMTISLSIKSAGYTRESNLKGFRKIGTVLQGRHIICRKLVIFHMRRESLLVLASSPST
jgi:hypothetical protein